MQLVSTLNDGIMQIKYKIDVTLTSLDDLRSYALNLRQLQVCRKFTTEFATDRTCDFFRE